MPGPAAPFAEEVAVALALAREAGAEAVRARSGPLEVAQKADRSLVTVVDRALDELLVSRLAARFPEDAVVGEESGERAPARPGPATRRWYVDPIDGTRNYAQGDGEYTVIVGLAEGDRAAAGVVVEPVVGVAFSGAAGGPARRQEGEAPPVAVHVSDRYRLRGGRCVRGRVHKPTASEIHLERYGVGPPARVGSLGLRIARVADGTYDFTFATDFRGGPWDLCGPLALLEAAGGLATDLSGHPIRFGPDAPLPQGLVVSNGRLHEAILAALATRPR
jgi:3'(2'), 5'-bisphosphate nucleotidase